MTSYSEAAALAEGARQSDVAAAHRAYQRVEAAYNAVKTAAGRAPLQAAYDEAERVRDAAVRSAKLAHDNRLAVAAAAFGVTRFGLPGDPSDPDAVAWCAARGIGG